MCVCIYTVNKCLCICMYVCDCTISCVLCVHALVGMCLHMLPKYMTVSSKYATCIYIHHGSIVTVMLCLVVSLNLESENAT